MNTISLFFCSRCDTMCFVWPDVYGWIFSAWVACQHEWPLATTDWLRRRFLIEYTPKRRASTGILVYDLVFVLRANSMRATKVIYIMRTVYGQIALGATVITERLHAVLVTAHLALGLALYSSLIFVVINTYYTNLRLKSLSASATLYSDSGFESHEKRTSAGYSPNKSANL